MKKYDESESVLLNLRDGGKFNNNMERILVEIGQIYSAKEEFEEAIEVFKDVDTTYRYTQSAGLAQFKLAEIYQKKIRDYDSTLKYFNKVIASSYIGNERTIATEQVRNFDKYFQLKNKKDELNLQIVYLQQPDKYLRDSTDYDIAYNEYLQEMRKKADMMNQMNYGIQQQNQTNPDNHQQIQQQQQTAIKNPNEKLSLAKLIEIGKAKKPVKPLVSLDSMKVILAQNYYELASHFFSELEVPDSAFFYFNSILNDYPNRTNKAQTLYALGTYFETLEQREKADSLYKIIYDEFPKSDLYKEAAKKLGLLKEEDKKSVAQTSDPAEELYLNAEKNYYDKKFREAIKEFRNIYLSHPKSNYAPKAIFFIGLIHEELKENDSAAFYYGILSSKENAATPLGSKVFSKYTEYKNEKERLEKIELEKQEAEKQKALLEKQKAVTDSVKVNPAMLTNEKDEVDIRPIKRDSTNVQNKKVISDSTAMKKSVPDSTQKK
jgi:outer membrane protein assembly factor BamD (BamD/ComL family)